MERKLTNLTMMAVSAACFSITSAYAQTSQLIQQGVKACSEQSFAVAEDYFVRAAKADPSSVTAWRYLGTVELMQSVPGSPINDTFAQKAEATFKKVLALDPSDDASIAALGALAQQQQKPDEARAWYEKLATLEPGNADAWLALGFIDWYKSWRQLGQARAELHMKIESPGPIANARTRADLNVRIGPAIDHALAEFKQVLKIDPRRKDAMRYLELALQARADLANTPAEYAQWIKEAGVWKRAQSQAEGSSHTDLSPCDARGVFQLMFSPPPPTPPLPPPPPPSAGGPGRVVRR